MRLKLLLCLLVQLLLAHVNAELNSTQEGILLDLQNYYRASNAQAAVRLVEWSTDLASKAQAYVARCDAVDPPAGIIQFYNSSGPMPDDEITRLLHVVERWVKDDNQNKQLFSRRSTHIGCAQAFCDRLPTTASTKVLSSSFYACAYNPRFFEEKPNQKLICIGRVAGANCPTDAPNCVEFPRSRAEELGVNTQTALPMCSTTNVLPQVPASPVPTSSPVPRRRVTNLTPRYGSIAGGQTVTIYGEGFSASNFDGANEVVFVRGSERIPCDVTDYSSSSVRIVCVTRASSVKTENTQYSIEVFVTIDGKREEVVDVCSWCLYNYNDYHNTPLIEHIEPRATTFGETVILNGRLFALTFEDVADPDDDEAEYDHYTRILVGGQLCNHMPDNDTMYEATLDKDGRYGTIECLPSTGFFLGSMNVSFFLDERGQSLIELDALLTSLDNKLQPYNFQTHADILDVSPRSGSRAGGTRIFVTLNTPLVNFTDIDTIKIFVGGVPCEGVALVWNNGSQSTVECTTGPQPLQTMYYPGARGLLREVWDTGYASLSTINGRPRTTNTAVHERTYLHSDFVSDFGELYYIGQRLSGFFVPPVTSMYTFGIRSDDASAFYLSPNSSSDRILDHEVAMGPSYTRGIWDYYDTQMSEPIFLKAGEYYYFVMVGNNGGGPWEMSIGAKVHNLSYNSYPYDGDYEEQLIEVSSTVRKEQHAINIEARPSVKKITITTLFSPTNAQIDCEIPISVPSLFVSGDLATPAVNVTISPNMNSNELEDLLNGLDAVQRVGAVRVIKDYENSEYFSDSSILDVQFTIVFVTSVSVQQSDIPELTLTGGSSVINCVNLDADLNATNTTDEEYLISVSIETTQNLTYPDLFNLGFEQPSQPPRYTPNFLLNVTTDVIETEVSNLFAWECDSDFDPPTENGPILYHADYEASSESNRDNETAFCGHYSERNPRTVWNDGDLNPKQYRYVCFAHKGIIPNFRVYTTYTEIQLGLDDTGVEIQYAIKRSNVNTRLNSCSNFPFSSQTITFASDGWSDLQCMDLTLCLQEIYEMSQDHVIDRMVFSSRDQFWIDEFVIARTDVSVTRRAQAPPISPNGISVKYIEVEGGILDTPLLLNFSFPVESHLSTESDSNNDTGSGGSGGSGMVYNVTMDTNATDSPVLERDFLLVVSTFRVTYTVNNCGFGMKPLVGYYSNMDALPTGIKVNVEQVAVGSRPVTGTFDLSIGDTYVRDIPPDVEGDVLEMLMEATFKDQGGFSVQRSGSCTGYSWDVQWETKGGDMPLMGVASDGLDGVEPMVTVTAVVDGGTWLRPIGGDMLRVPMDEPQVEVVVNDIPSSCRGLVCSFNFTDLATPTIHTISPAEGQGGEEITIYGIGFTNEMSDVTVSIGQSSCSVSAANSTQIKCVLSNHPAGFYNISVLIEGMGMAVADNTTCFHYLLSVDTITPIIGGVGGGVPITISGNGFLEFTPVPAKHLNEPFSFLPWFRYGLGLPSIEFLENLGMCPVYRDMLTERPFLDKYTVDSISKVMQDVEMFVQRSVNRNQSSENNSESVMSSGLPAELSFCNTFFPCEFNSTSFAVFNNGHFDFENLFIHLLNLYYHFPSYVLFGGTPCVITESSLTQMTCVPVTSLPVKTNVTVVVFSDTETLDFAYEVSLSDTPVVLSLEPAQGAVIGGTRVVITGTSFGASSQQDVNVTIGESECIVTSANDSHIECTTTSHRAGYQPVLISTPNGVPVLESGLMDIGMNPDGSGSGFGDDRAESSFFPVFEYKLVVYTDGAVLSSGSVFGGTTVTLLGGVFVPGDTRVLVGGQDVVLQHVDMDTIQFDTPTTTSELYIKLETSPLRVLTGVTQGVTLDLFWTEETIQVQVGDTVSWLLADSIHDLQEIQSVQLLLESTSADVTSATLTRGDSSGTFSYTFNQVGDFTLTGFSIPQSFGVPSVVVNVTGPRASFDEVEVFVGGYRAEYVSSGINKREADMSACGPSAPEEIETGSSPAISYTPCLTPVVSYVEPKMGFRFETVFTIRGSRFGDVNSLNEVSFGGHPCTVLSSNESTIECIMNEASGLPSVYSDLPIILRVVDLGNAYVVSEEDSTIQLQPFISGIDPPFGSVEGGTDVIVYGDGFPQMDVDAATEIVVDLNGLTCSVYAGNYTEVRCTTPASPDGTMQSVVKVELSMQIVACINPGGCNFTYSDDHTPKVESVYPTSINSTDPTLITIQGTGFGEDLVSNIVKFGDINCTVTEANDSSIVCVLPPLPATTYPLSLQVCNLSDNRCYGNAQILSEPDTTITSVPEVISISPQNGSVQGDTEVTISGRGFNTNPDDVQVLIGTVECFVTYINYSTIMCLTSPNTDGMYSVQISITDLSAFPATAQYSYSIDNTPCITGISPSSGNIGDIITLTGTLLESTADLVDVQFGEANCNVLSATETQITCSPESNFVGTYIPDVTISGMGKALIENVQFNFTLNIDSVSPTAGSFAGLNPILLEGSGFYPGDILITVCGVSCPLSSSTPSVSQVECIAPPMVESSSVVNCDVLVETLGEVFIIPAAYTYRGDLTPRVETVNRTRGGTAGGSILLITGMGFTGTASVTIAGSVCDVQSQTATEIVCVTGASGRNVQSTIMVEIDGMGYAISDVEFWYVDLWSSPFTWQDGIIPTAGDFVVVPKGQTLVLDVVTPVLAYILIQGGSLIFDQEKGDNEVELHTQGGLITSDGVFQVGTEQEPFLSKTQIVLYGHVLSTEIPVYGAKTLALRRGTLDIHGRQLNVTWTKLAMTAAAGSSMLHLQKYVDWDVGGSVVIASTSFSQRENEERIIQSISAGSEGSILTLTEPLDYEHISVQQTIDGRFIDTSGEVGYLTRNVVIRGNVNEDWLEEAPSCPENFRPGQFEVQTCFLGRFGAESLSDQFGSQVMIHASEQNEGHVTARFGYVEVTHAGQAFRLGRYPIHYHLNGNVSGSYVRGCGIHHTFNRAVTVHAVDYLLIENNVAFNILGHAYFLEDGIEEHNIIQDNLGVFVRASSSLLNVDITPATFWIVNPSNIVRRNAAAGGTHFGFWYRLPEHPTGPSATTSVNPRQLPVEEFSDNTAHSFGWYGLWVYQAYHPSQTVYYDRFTAWRCDRGVEFTEVGSLQLRDSVMLDNRFAGVEVVDISAVWAGDEEDGPLIKDTLIVGYSDISVGDFCTESGIKTPHSYYLTVSGVTFANFDRPDCYPIQACSHCKMFQGGFETRYKGISYINEGDDITRWQWSHEHIHRDLDGTLTKSDTPSLLIPSSELLSPTECKLHPASSDGVDGVICDIGLTFGRLAVYNPIPTSLQFTNLNISNEFGTDEQPYIEKRLRGGAGQMAVLVLNETYQLTWVEGTTFTNISYSTLISGFAEDDYVLFTQSYPRSLDYTNIRGVTTASNVSALENPANAVTGDFYITDNTSLTYIVKGPEELNGEPELQFSTYRCFYENCIPPPPPTLPPPRPEGRPDVVQSWSNSSIWPDNQLPQAGADVYINSSMYVLVDMPLPRLGTLTIAGAVELLDSIDHQIEADFIIVDGGRLAIGYPDTPFQHKAKIVLHGNQTSKQISRRLKRNFGTNIGAKALAVFGELIMHGVSRQPTWTTLAQTAMAGANTIVVEDTVTWVPGDVIVITSTSYDAFETEVFEISSVDSNSNTITLNSTLVNAHSGGDFDSLGVGNRYTTRAEVGLLSRNIVITNDDNSLANSEAFGCRVLVTHNDLFTGAAQIEGVEFSGCGQLGYTEEFDPRFALALLNIEDSYVRSCSFHDGYNTAIGVFASFGVSLADNVIHNTVGPSLVASGSDHSITHNLASLAQFIGTYRNRDEPSNDLWTANFEVIDVASLTLVGNAAAGGAKAGYHTNGEDCASSSSTTMIRDNTAHSSLHGVHLGYTDGNPSGCSRLANFNIFNCFHYGIFSYSLAGLEVVDTVLTNNKAAVYVSVIGPASLSHVRGVKSVLFERVLVVSSSEEFTCEEDSKRPAIADHKTSHFGLRSPTNGHLGFLIPSFLSGQGHFPKFPWHTIISYPAINGLTEMKQVTFANFHEQCPGKVDTVLMTSPLSEDANHPVHMSDITFVSDNRFESSVTPDAKLFVHRPNLGRVNPSDCVDMECDGHKQVLLKDAAGTFTQSEDGEDRTIISEAEFEWDGDPRRGLGDYRIPRTMLTYPNGSRIDISSIYPKKGIIRGVSDFADEQDCLFNSAWNMYECKSIDHLMLVLESLDADTEVRRLSPIGLGANGFISLLNGPMDNGWCGGYTCQERISTFFGIVGSGVQYTIGLTSTNPQNFAMYLLNADSTQGIVVGIIYTNPQRLDVYHNGVYVLPTNAERDENMNIKYLPADPNIQNQFIPVLSDEPGSNFFDRGTKQLYINVKGDATYRIETKPVVVLSLTLQVSVDDFFDEVNLIRNLALLLEIPENKIRVVSVSRETVSRRKRADDGGSVMQTIELEFGDPPDETLTEEPVDTGNTTGSGMNMTDSSGGQNETDVLSIEDLEDISERVVEVTQTGEISQALNSTANITSASIEEPIPPPVDETGGVRATPDTGGPQPEEFGDNSTAPPTFSEIQMMEEEAELNMTDEIVFSIPTMLDITYEPSANERILEGIALQDYAPVIAMLDNNGEVVVNLGLDIPWVLTAQIVSGPDGSFTTEASTNFTKGQAVLSSLVFSHPGEYIMTYSVTFPASADFGVTSSLTMTVLPRDLQLLVTQEPTGGNTTFILFPYPRVSLVDLVSEESIEEHAWRNSTWFIIASVTSVPGSNLIGRTEIELVNGQATFTDIQISSPGEYWIEFEAYTIPTAMMSHLPVKVSTRQFTIRELPITKLDVIYNVDFNSTVGGNEEAFIDEFSVQFYIAYPSIEIINITLTEGSIIVSVIVTASNPQQLVDLASHATSGLNFQSLSFTFNSTSLTPSNVTQDSAYLVFVPTLPPSIIQQHLVLILATVIPGGAILIVLCVLAIICCVVYKHKSRRRVFKIKVQESNGQREERYVQNTMLHRDANNSPVPSSVDEFYLLPDSNLKDFETRSFESHELDSMASTPANQRKADIVVSEKVKVPATSKSLKLPGSFFSNPSAEDTMDESNADGLETLDTNMSVVVDIPTMNGNSNNNNDCGELAEDETIIEALSMASTAASHQSVQLEGISQMKKD